MPIWLALAGLLSGTAEAASVRVVLDRPLNLLAGGGARPAQLDGALPAGEAFNLDVPLPADIDATGTLRLWPRTGDTCAARMPTEGPQRQVVGMSAATSEYGDRVLRARVAPLQVQQPYCISVEPSMTLTGAALDSFSLIVADELVHQASLPKAACPWREDPVGVAEALRAATQTTGLDPGAAIEDALVREAVLAFERSGGRAACDALRDQRILAEEALIALNRLQEIEGEALNTLKGLPKLPAPPSPYVLVDGELVQIGILMAQDPSDAALGQAEGQLRSCDLVIAPSCVAWAKRVESVLGASGAARSRATEQALRQAVAAPKELNLYVEGGLRSLSAIRSGGMPADAHDLELQLQQLADKGAEAGLSGPWISALGRLDRISDGATRTRAELEAARVAMAQAEAALRAAWTAAIRSDAVAGRLVVNVGQIGLGQLSSSGLTRGGVNYVTPIGGAAVALPSNGDTRSAWAAPYVGINIYSVPAERIIPLSELAGQPLRQRTSLTAGVLLDNTPPPLEGYATQPAFRNAYPLVAGNVRLMRHVGVAVGAVWVRVEDPNPASATTQMLAMPFVGASLDFDVIRLLSNTLNEL